MRFEYRTLPDDAGAVRFFAEQVVPAHGVPGYVGTISDFTDLVTARGDLRKAETLYRNTFDQAPDRHRLYGSRRQVPALQ